jgi:RNA polymerase sigma-70 factor (ECF subfamily)
MTDKWNTQLTLVKRAQDPNDQQAWHDFVRHYQPFIEITLRRLTHRSSEYDDLIQETLLIIWKSLSDFKFKPHPGGFRRWLSTIIRNRVIDLVRKNNNYNKRNESAAQEKLIQEEFKKTEMETIIVKDWERHITQTALTNVKQYFSGTAVVVFELSLKGFSASEISKKLEIHQDSVRTLKNRVKNRVVKEVQRLRTELEF